MTNTIHMAIGQIFTAATQLSLRPQDRKLIIAQPGYRRGEQMKLARTSGNGIRLFVAVSGKWMDGSLQSII